MAKIYQGSVSISGGDIPAEYLTENEVPALTKEEIIAICDFDGNPEGDIIPVATKNALGCVVVGDGLNVDENGVTSVDIGKLYKVGSVYVTSTNENPSSYLGGTWVLLNKVLKDAVYSMKTVGIEYINTTSAEVYATTSNNSINVQFSFTTSIDMSEDSIKWFNVDWTKIGISALPWSPRLIFYSDGGNAIAFGTIHYNDNSIMTNDVIVRGGTGTLPAGSTLYGSITLPVTSAHILDEFCDKFYWSKTSNEAPLPEPEPVEPTIISFTIGGTSYQAEEGMTFSDWVDSEYNTGGFSWYGDIGYQMLYRSSSGNYVWDAAYTDGIRPDDTVNAGEAYILD